MPRTARPSWRSSTSGPRSRCWALAARSATLGTARQGDLEQWADQRSSHRRREAGNFVRWARRQKLTRARSCRRQVGRAQPAHRHRSPMAASAPVLLHDDTLKPEDRVAGPAGPPLRPACRRPQPPHPRARPDLRAGVRIRLGREPYLLPEPPPLILVLVAEPAGATPPSATGIFAMAVSRRPPGRPSAQTGSPDGYADSACAPRKPAAPHVPARRRTARRPARPDARHPHWRRRRLAAASSGDWTNYAATTAAARPQPAPTREVREGI